GPLALMAITVRTGCSTLPDENSLKAFRISSMRSSIEIRPATSRSLRSRKNTGRRSILWRRATSGVYEKQRIVDLHGTIRRGYSMRAVRRLSAGLIVAATVVGVALGHANGSSWWGHVQALANDEMAGRNTGSAEYQRAAEYVAAQFRNAGLEPAGNDGY